MRKYAINDLGAIVLESVGESYCAEAGNVSDVSVTTQPPAAALADWRAARELHSFHVITLNAVERPYVTCELSLALLGYWRGTISGNVFAAADIVASEYAGPFAAWLAGDDAIPEEDERLMDFGEEMGKLEEAWLLQVPDYEAFLDALPAAERDAFVASASSGRLWFDTRRVEIGRYLGES